MAHQDLTLTLLGLCVCALLGFIGFRRHFAPHDELRPRMVPWMIISLGSIATAFMLIVHLVNLMGIETGRS